MNHSCDKNAPKIRSIFDIETESWWPLFSHSNSVYEGAIIVIKKAPKFLHIFENEIESGGLYFHIPIQPINGPFLWTKNSENSA